MLTVLALILLISAYIAAVILLAPSQVVRLEIQTKQIEDM